jgi:hypothetical protein
MDFGEFVRLRSSIKPGERDVLPRGRGGGNGGGSMELLSLRNRSVTKMHRRLGLVEKRDVLRLPRSAEKVRSSDFVRPRTEPFRPCMPL